MLPSRSAPEESLGTGAPGLEASRHSLAQGRQIEAPPSTLPHSRISPQPDLALKVGLYQAAVHMGLHRWSSCHLHCLLVAPIFQNILFQSIISQANEQTVLNRMVSVQWGWAQGKVEAPRR